MNTPDDIHEWSRLNKDASYLIEEITDKWNDMLNDTSLTEPDYHKFISKNAGLFYGDPCNSFVLLSQIKLGSDYVPDLVQIFDNESYGFIYRFIELESPHDLVYTKSSRPSSSLTEAVQQIHDWKRWIEAHLSSAKELFPSKAFHVWGDPQFQYQIVIGRRDSELNNTHKRNQLSKELGVEIRSYDRLTSNLRKRMFTDIPFVDFQEPEPVSDLMRNKLANPFYEAFSHSQWKAFLKEPKLYTSHMVALNAEKIVRLRKYNELVDAFTEFESNVQG